MKRRKRRDDNLDQLEEALDHLQDAIVETQTVATLVRSSYVLPRARRHDWNDNHAGG